MNNCNVSGTLYIVSAPSGAGKTSLVTALLESSKGISVSVSHTTRVPRSGEEDGVQYHFTDTGTFKEMVEQGAFLEHAQVFDNFYGTSIQAVKDQLAQGQDVILEIDWQGGRLVRAQLPDAIGIFIMPPSEAVLEERLRGRGTDSDEIIARRMRDARNEASHYDEYDYLIINDDFDCALTDLRSVFVAKRLELARQQQQYAAMLKELLA